MSEGVSLLLDTNVWIDAFVPTRSRHQLVRKLLRNAIERDAKLLYPVRILPDVFYQVAAEAKRWWRQGGGELTQAQAEACHSHAWECVNDMHELATAVGADEADVWLALKYRTLHEDVEDNFVLAAAQRAHANYLVTSDMRLITKAPVAALTPQDMLAVLCDLAE